jgi:hypothetical protein
MKATSIPTADAPDAGNRIPPFALAVVFIFVLFAVDSLDGASFYADVDDKMRLLQIRDLLGDGQWHDLTMPFHLDAGAVFFAVVAAGRRALCPPDVVLRPVFSRPKRRSVSQRASGRRSCSSLSPGSSGEWQFG